MLSNRITNDARNVMRRTKLVWIAFLLFGCAGAAAWPQQGRAASVREACAPDYQKLCSGTRPGGGRIAACFRQNAAQLSEQCRSALLAAKAARQ